MKYSINSIKKSRNKTEPITNILYDYFGILSTWFISNFTRITPNQVSTFGLILGFISAYFFLQGNLFIGGLIYIGRILMDNIDGRLARVIKRQSKWGAWYENYTGLTTIFINTLAICYSQYIITGKIIWLIFAPLILHSFRLHNWESMKVAILLGDKFKEEVVNSKSKVKSLSNNIKEFLEKHKIQRPFNSSDGTVLIFILGPITGFLFEAIILWLAATAIWAVFWFFYYKSILLREDIKESKSKKND